jgi:ketosteroid isomerase-like protein
MRKWTDAGIFAVAIVLLTGAAIAQAPNMQRGGGAAPATGPIADVVNAIVNAYNNSDTSFFDKTMTADALWFDEDGHVFPAKAFVSRQITATPKRKLTISDLKVGMSGDSGWAGFSYVIDNGGSQKRGVNTTLFRKTGTTWQIVLVHGAVNPPATMAH